MYITCKYLIKIGKQFYNKKFKLLLKVKYFSQSHLLVPPLVLPRHWHIASAHIFPARCTTSNKLQVSFL